MQSFELILAVAGGVVLILFLILYLRIHAYIALFLASITVGILAGTPTAELMGQLQKGMGNTLGFVATIVGLGAMFGAMLEQSGGAYSLAGYLLRRTGEKNASWAMAATGLLVAIPVFFEVAFIILIPIAYAIHRKTGKSVLLYSIPLLAGLAISHAFIPPSPGSVAVSEIIGANLGWVIITGSIAGIPALVLSGPVFARYISKKIAGTVPNSQESDNPSSLPPAPLIIALILIPILLIIFSAFLDSSYASILSLNPRALSWLKLLGHPFSALIIANLIAWYVLGIRRGYSKDQLLSIAGKSLAPAGGIMLIIGAGGMFKQVLNDTGAGKLIASTLTSSGMSYLLFAFIIAALIRVMQGSATVAMITSAGMTSSLTSGLALGPVEKALIVTSISSGATILSHVNDAGFWLVNRYLGITEKETFSSWTVVTCIIAFTGLITVLTIEWLIH